MFEDHLLRKLIDLSPDKDFTGFNVFDFIYSEGSPLEAITYSMLFWPDFVEIDGMVFLKWTFENQADFNRLQQALLKYGGDRQKTEESFNFFDVSSLFGRRIGDTTDEEDSWLLERLAQMWHFRLHQLFPERTFSVQVLSAEQSGDEAGLVFFQQVGDKAVLSK